MTQVEHGKDCLGCGGKGFWYSPDNGQRVDCLKYTPAPAALLRFEGGVPGSPAESRETELTMIRNVIQANVLTMAAALKRLGAAMRIDHDVNGDAMVVLMQFGSADAEFTPAEIARMLGAIVVTFRDGLQD